MFIAVDHPPDIPLVDVVGKAGMFAPWQYGPALLNVGTTVGRIVRSSVAVFGQPLALVVT